MNDKMCCGCSACSIICPTNAIKMNINKNGFYRPIIDKNKCINCGLCDKVCIYKNEESYPSIANLGLYSAYSKSTEIRKKSSSGGIATEIAKQYLDNDYDICGVRYNIENNDAEHIVITKNNLQMLKEIQGSKYIQSKNEKAFSEIIYLLNNNIDKKIVVFGTPCQIAGLYNVLKMKKKLDNVILIDIFCHGIPSYNLWNMYLKKIKKAYGFDNNISIEFRDKNYGWHEYHMNINDSKKQYIKKRDRDLFYLLFLGDYCDSESCYKCKFRNNSLSDLRLGDYWGNKYKNDEKGYSMVAVNTKKGENILKSLDNINYLKTDINDRMSQQIDEKIVPKEYNRIMEKLKRENPNFSLFLIKKSLKRNIKRVLKFIKNGE